MIGMPVVQFSNKFHQDFKHCSIAAILPRYQASQEQEWSALCVGTLLQGGIGAFETANPVLLYEST